MIFFNYQFQDLPKDICEHAAKKYSVKTG